MNGKSIAYLNVSSPVQRACTGIAAFVLLLCAACSSTSYPPVPDAQRSVEVDYDYILAPGDSVSIFVWGNQELGSNSQVRPDGKLSTHLVEDLQAAGKTSTQLARDIEVAYAEYVREPVVSVIVSGFVGVPDQTVRVVGEATNPKRIPYRKYMTLLDLMIDVNGLTEYADGNKSVLIRMVDGQQVTYSLRLDDLLMDGDITANLSLMPGDVLIVAESWF
jgi:polysaccharide biosynthesis/export protein